MKRNRNAPRRSGLCALALAAAFPGPAPAQPEPSFEASCGELRDALERLQAPENAWVTIDVVGELEAVKHDGTLGYMLVCAPPDPQVLCITYEVGAYTPGERVILSGTLNRLDADRIRLDPCLHYPPDAERIDDR